MRQLLLKLAMEKAISPSILRPHTDMMHGKSNEEKEKIAAEIIEKIKAGEIK